MIVPALALAAFACDSSSVLSMVDRQALADARHQWEQRGFANYSFEVRQSCFCDLEVQQWTRIDVVGNQIAAAVLVATGAPVPAERWSLYPTIEELFSQIDQRQPDWIQEVKVEYDPQLGFPTRVEFAPKPNVVDAGLVYNVRNVRPLPTLD
jgi:hypothetical protein